MFRLGLIRCHLVGNVFAFKTWFQCQKLYAWATEVLLLYSANRWCDRVLRKWRVLLISPLTGHRLGLSCFAYLLSCLSNRSCVRWRLMRPIGTFESKPRRILYWWLVFCSYLGVKVLFSILVLMLNCPVGHGKMRGGKLYWRATLLWQKHFLFSSLLPSSQLQRWESKREAG